MAIAAILVGAVYVINVFSNAEDIDRESLCPPNPISETVLIVDVTDPLSVAQKQDFYNQLNRLTLSIPRHGRLSVFQLKPADKKLLEPVFQKCNPGSAADVSEADSNPAKLQRLWESEFKKPIDDIAQELATAAPADVSPIFEAVQSVALTVLQKPGSQGKPRRLIIMSDLLQHSSDISFYKGLPSADVLVDSPPFQKVATDLSGIDVELLMLRRPDEAAITPRELAELWERIVDAEGGAVTRVYRI